MPWRVLKLQNDSRMEKPYYLNDELEFIQAFERTDEFIVWVYRRGESVIYSKALREITEKFYCKN